MANQWFIADIHDGHRNIIKYCERPFKDEIEQHKKIVENCNSRIKDDDWVYHVGDYCFRNSAGGKTGEGTIYKASYWQKDYKGHWIYIRGSHDNNNSLKTPIEKIYIKFGGKRICLVHDPKHVDPNVPLNIVGHVHKAWKIKRINEKSIMFNVGVDVNNFFPVNYEEINKALSQFIKNEKKQIKN